MLYRAKSPGSLMLFGEYAVLHGKTAIVAAIDKFISVKLIPHNDKNIHIQSSLGELIVPYHKLEPLAPPFQFVLATLASKKLPSGCKIIIESDLPCAMGLGSSSAVTVALLTVLNNWLKINRTRNQLWQEARDIISVVQGEGSGADCAASIYGGVIAFRNNPLRIISLKSFPPLIAVYSGKKLTTARAIDIVNKKRQQHPDFYQDLDKRLDTLSLQAIDVINEQNWKALGHLLNEGQELMKNLGVSNQTLDYLINQLCEKASVFGAKISGAGLGDCVIAVGDLTPGLFPQNKAEADQGIKQIPIAITDKGTCLNEA